MLNRTRTSICAVPHCGEASSSPSNLCPLHRLPGLITARNEGDQSGRSFSIFGWYTENGEYIPLGESTPVPWESPEWSGQPIVVGIWYVEHDGDVGLIYFNDYALGQLFDSRVDFERRLAQQGFTHIRNLRTAQELERAKTSMRHKRIGNWSGPWLMVYPWQKDEFCPADTRSLEPLPELPDARA